MGTVQILTATGAHPVNYIMRKAFLFTFMIALSTIAIVSYFRLIKRAPPKTYLGKKNVSYLEKEDIGQWLETSYKAPYRLKIRDRVYVMELERMGVLLDVSSTLRSVFEKNNKPFPSNIISFVQGYSSQRMLMPGLVFTSDFSAYIDKSTYDFTDRNDEVTVDNGNKVISLKDNEQVYKIDGEHLKSLVLFNYGQQGATIEPRLIQVIKAEKMEKIQEQNKKIGSVFLSPLEIVLQDEGGLLRTTISPSELKSIYEVEYRDGKVEFGAKEDALTYLLDAKIDPLIKRNRQVDMKTLKKNILSAFESRTRGINSGPLIATIKNSDPTQTRGEIASRYIEVSISKQKMYLFDQGQMLKSYPISSGLYYPTPTGHFNIMNKALEGYSDIFNVYMPYWMAFYFGWAGEQDAYFGIHELPYWYVGDERKQRPREFLGSPHTGGCLSLDIGAAKEVYDFSFVGMDVVIFN